jgi:response regulator RpfG family c-di-GMP phosphodiesterase
MDPKTVILCIDDEEINLSLLEAMLVPQGYQVLHAGNGKEALAVLKKERVDLVLLDVLMPEMNGFDTCRFIRNDETLQNIPVIMITALTSREDRIRSIETGADDFITKPFHQEEILARIKMLLKMKNLNERLNSSYHNVLSLVSYGEEIAKSFKARDFDFFLNIDLIVNRIIRHRPEMTELPGMVLVGCLSDNNWGWYRYESTGELQRREIPQRFEQSFPLPEKNESQTAFYNRSELDRSLFHRFLAGLRETGITVTNMVCYISADLCIFALNYQRDVGTYDAAVLNSLVVNSRFLKSLSQQIKETKDAFEYTVYALARASEANDFTTGNHILRVGEFSAMLARELDLPENFVQTIRVQALLHDVGKIHIPSSILQKHGKLTPKEREEMQKHTFYGVNIIGEHPMLGMGKTIALSHHEHWDGTGYPNGLRGDQIPLEGRILAIVDQYDALRSLRPYKAPFSHQKAMKIITKGDKRTRPEHFDPWILTKFTANNWKFEKVYQRLID